MRDKVMSSLPAKARWMALKIESYARKEISWLIDDNKKDIDDIECRVNEHGAVILLNSDSLFPSLAIVHELSHIERYWCEQTPQIIPRDNHEYKWFVTGHIDNTLEHLTIVPRMKIRGFDQTDYWREKTRSAWATFPWPDVEQELTRKIITILAYIDCEYADDQKVNMMADEAIMNSPYRNQAIELRRFVHQGNRNKKDLIAATVHHLGLPADDFFLVTFDIRNQRRLVTALPVF